MNGVSASILHSMKLCASEWNVSQRGLSLGRGTFSDVAGWSLSLLLARSCGAVLRPWHSGDVVGFEVGLLLFPW